VEMVAATARERGWPENEVAMLVDPIVGYATAAVV